MIRALEGAINTVLNNKHIYVVFVKQLLTKADSGHASFNGRDSYVTVILNPSPWWC